MSKATGDLDHPSSPALIDDLFIEVIDKNQKQEHLELFVPVVISAVPDPKQISTLLKELSQLLPIRKKQGSGSEETRGKVSNKNDIDPSLSHLKRVRKRFQKASTSSNSINDNETELQKFSVECDGTVVCSEQRTKKHNLQKNSPPLKRPKNADNKANGHVILEVILGYTFSYYEEMLPEERKRIEEKYKLAPYIYRVPSRAAESKKEFEMFSLIWPMLFNLERTDEFKVAESMLHEDDIQKMKYGMEKAIDDAEQGGKQWMSYFSQRKIIEYNMPKIGGAIILDPFTGEVVSTASNERSMMASSNFNKADSVFPDIINPLCTPIMLAIQGISRNERNNALKYPDGMANDEFRKGQYLCTGYDAYVTLEPNMYESMALVHSRIRNVIFGVHNREDGGLGGSKSEVCINSMPGTNHHYRAFHLNTCCNSILFQKCKNIHL
uniref:CMP/dCMP-type deaminase domain-containing protein n=1 Tax=Corethron hystrix TaxID=216773 RepID=A0A7S1FNW1_9STRA|mmetsp:Transcript_19251/g.43837  ORF Transcript_19251/g.43837 Transcript_19251/m.43837 type:complete len:439 (+) Transcript_19251:140-1456(+)